MSETNNGAGILFVMIGVIVFIGLIFGFTAKSEGSLSKTEQKNCAELSGSVCTSIHDFSN